MGEIEDRGRHPDTRGPVSHTRIPAPDPVCIAIDILDEDHSLRAGDAAAGARRGAARAARPRGASLVAARAFGRGDGGGLCTPHRRGGGAARPPAVELPAHLRADGTRTLRSLAAPLGLIDALSQDGLLE